ncbi:MAG: PspC domain-containing protein [Clostridia bacterium]|nr:PspC domain-containing protein [Clostridia bacterium]
MKKKLYRSVKDKKFCGVCAGVGEYFDIDPTIIRIIYALLTVFSVGFPGIILYIILAFIIPENPVSDMDDDFNSK